MKAHIGLLDWIDEVGYLMKAFATRYPFLFAAAVSLTGVLSMLWPFWVPGLSTTTQILLARVSVLVIAVGLLTTLHWWREAGFVKLSSWRVTLPYLPLACLWVLPSLLSLITGGVRVTDLGLILFGCASYLAGAFFEEAIFRGVVLRALLPGGLLRANLLAATLFATVHLAGLAVGADPTAAALQWAYTWLFGFAAVAALAYARNIWPLVVIHFLANYCGYLASGDFFNTAAVTPSQILMAMIIMTPATLYGFWLLRRAGRRQVEPVSAHTSAMQQP